MSNNIEIENTSVEIKPLSSISLSGIDDISTCVQQEQEIVVQKNQYSIVGDALYASVDVNEAPLWLTSIIDSLIDLRIAGSLSDLDDLRATIILSLSELEIAKNQYQELINIETTIDQIITSRLTTLNASMDQANANIITLQLTSVTATQAAAIAATQISSSLLDGAIKSAINEVSTTVASLDESVANIYTSLVSAIEGVGEATSEVEVLANVLKDRLEASWSYNAKLLLADGSWYRSGFGLNTSVQTDGDGTEANPYLSEFWINAQKFKFTNTGMTGTVTPFTIDASGTTPAITFTGNVVINNRNNAVTGGIPVFLGNFSTPPTAQVNGDTYKNTVDGIVYTWDGDVWTSTAGSSGVGVASSTVEYQASTSGTSVPTGSWTTTVPTVPAGEYLWTRTIFTYTNATETTTYAVSRQGANGSNGTGISTSQVHYQAGISGVDIPTDAWVSSIPAVPDGWYLWSRTTLTFTNGSTQVTYSVARNGIDGDAGHDGIRGAGFFRIGTTTGVWSDITANSALPDGVPVVNDTVTIYQISNPAVATTKMYSGAVWVTPALSVHGDMVVDGTIVGQKLVIGTIQGQHMENGSSSTGITAVKFNDWLLSDTQPNGTPTTGFANAALALNFRTGDAYLRNIYARGDIEASSMKAGSIFVGGTIQSTNFNPANPTAAGWRISSDGSAHFNGIVVTRTNVVAQGTLSLPATTEANADFDRSGLGIMERNAYRESIFTVDVPTGTFTPDDVGNLTGKMLTAQAVVTGSDFWYTGSPPAGAAYETPCIVSLARVARYSESGSFVRLYFTIPVPTAVASNVNAITIRDIQWALSTFT